MLCDSLGMPVSTMNLAVFGDHEDKVLEQAMRCIHAEADSFGSLSADGHFGYSAPIGLSWALREHVSPAAVGYDIGCGNLAVATNVHADGDFKTALPGIMDRIYTEVNFGMNRRGGGVDDDPVFDSILEAEYEPVRALIGKARAQLGTVGGGNHYVDLFADETNRVWVGVHFGSRGFGWTIGNGFMAMAQGKTFEDKAKEDMEAPPGMLHLGSTLGYLYLDAMQIAGEYAYAGREHVVAQVLGILGAQPFGERIHNHHNYAWPERHRGDDVLVIRKGATPAQPGQKGFVGASMGEPAVILEGVESDLSADTLYSTVHGAGRAMSRTRAAGKQRNRWTCNTRDCAWVQPPATQKPNACPECGNTNLTRRWVKEREGEIDWKAALDDLKAKGIELRGANAEEAPLAYKRLHEVLGYHDGTVRILHTLTPLGVAMAAGDVKDPYRD